MKTVIELASAACMQRVQDRWIANEVELQRFAALVKAARDAELVAGVEMPEPAYRAKPYSSLPIAAVSAAVDYYTADQLRDYAAAAVAKKDAEISAIRAAHQRYEADTMAIAQTDDEVRASLTSQRDALKAENERLRAESKPNCRECTKWAKEQADNAEWIEGVKRGKEICKQLAKAALKGQP